MARTHSRFGLMAVAIVHLKNGPTPEVLRHALGQAQERHPLLRARVAAVGRRGRLEVLDSAPPTPLVVRDWKSEDEAMSHAQELLNEPFLSETVPLLRCVYLYGSDRSDLVLAFHHAVMDGTSAVRLCHDLLVDRSDLDAAPLKPRRLPPPSDAAFPASARGLRHVPRLVRFVARELRADRRYLRQTSPEHRPPLRREGPTWIRSMSLSERETGALVRRSRLERATLASVVASAMLLTVAEERYPTDTPMARAIVFSDLRPYLVPRPAPEELACHVAMQRLTVSLCGTETQDESSLWTVARRISKAVHEANRRGEKFLAARMARHVVGRELKREDQRMGTIALSFMGGLDLRHTYGETEVLGVHAFIATNRLSPELSASGHLFHGRLRLDVMFSPEDFSPNEAEALLRRVARRLTL